MKQRMQAGREPSRILRCELGARIRGLRRRRAWSQERLAGLCGMSVSHLARVERGQTEVTLGTLLLIARPLRITISRLLAGIPS